MVKSDHSPILLSTQQEDCCARGASRGRLFGYEVMWRTNKVLSSLISQVWNDVTHCENLMELNRKLSWLASTLQLKCLIKHIQMLVHTNVLEIEEWPIMKQYLWR
jgi:hypothetical protein